MLQRRRLHCRSLGPRHDAKFPNMDSLVRLELFRGSLGRRLYPPGREVPTEQRADPGCAATRDLRHRCSPSPRLVWPPPSPALPARALPFLPLRSAQPRRHMSARYGDDCGGGGGGGSPYLLDVPPARTAATFNQTTGGRWQTTRSDLRTWRAE